MKARTTTITDLRGNKITLTYGCPNEALQRLAHLDEQEEESKRITPTNSGDVRFNYLKEGIAIRKLLSSCWECGSLAVGPSGLCWRCEDEMLDGWLKNPRRKLEA